MADRFKDILEEVSDTATLLWQKGWAERNGGNISINVTGMVEDFINDSYTPPYVDLQINEKQTFTRDQFDQSLADELTDRFPDRSATHRDFLGDEILSDAGSGNDLEVQQFVLDEPVGILLQTGMIHIIFRHGCSTSPLMLIAGYREHTLNKL